MMLFTTSALLAGLFACLPQTIGHPSPLEARSTCTDQMKIAAVRQEIKTIRSHSLADANKIPLDPLASRTFIIMPAELPGVSLPPVNVGVTATTVRDELVGLGTVLNAKVPQSSVHIYVDSNGTVTSDFIQNNQIVLPHVQVRETHTFNSACQIVTILGYVSGSLVCPSPSENEITLNICSEYAAAGGT